ncbi:MULTISPECIES: YesL family protein [Cytobacillus]|uniref:YesL family protein n=1 Tax=Cytobacillus TaxID=2675230 RepID=UPI00203AD27E|nr:YesL family protein [Cytobacillus oceanisediminis]MBY0159555.1 YesL family protein [Cytobacillus firmus]MCM3403082.1 YesL family protein [Cytobacillus oceanisediminis]MCM3527694.1 YesL family protein [Cytobacillus oceanisediminis]MDK7665920.1 YesL family protein [Cytobacillus oceanisediminis]
MQNMLGKLFTICEWIMKLAYVNLLWLLFTMAGLIVFGFMPATVSLFTIVRKWQMKETEVPVWDTFLSIYKKEFTKSNLLGFILVICAGFILLDLHFVNGLEGVLQLMFFVLLLIISALYFITLMYLFPVYVHYDLRVSEYIKNSCLLGILNLHLTLIIAASAGSIIFLLLYSPAFIPFFSAVSITWILMYGGMYSFRKIEARQKHRQLEQFRHSGLSRHI